MRSPTPSAAWLFHVISANGQSGVFLNGSGVNNNTVAGNYIGLDYTGTYADGNQLDGVRIDGGANNTIGGAQSAVLNPQRNVISANGGNGVTITTTEEDTAAASGNIVSGNYIGTDQTGQRITDPLANSLGNAAYGVFIDKGQSNTIGGVMNGDSDAVNLISGNATGIGCGGNAQSNNVLGNYVGTNVAGTAALANGTGIVVGGTSNNIGNGNANALNLVSGNTGDGIAVTGSSITVKKNWVGVTIAGNVGLGNGHNGILLDGASTATVSLNVIANNGTTGSVLWDGLQIVSSNNATVKGNKIGLGADGVTLLGNKADGIFIVSSSGDVIGGAGADVNYIADNNGWGINLAVSATGNTLNDNWVGYDKNGKLDANQGGGVNNQSGSNTNNIPAGHVQP
jgi:hypothetical protein